MYLKLYTLLLFIQIALLGEEQFYTLKEIKENYLVLEDGSEWKIGRRYTGALARFRKGDSLTISYYPNYSTTLFNNTAITNLNISEIVWGVIQKPPIQIEPKKGPPFQNIFELAESLSRQVLDQPDAVQAVTSAVINYCSGLNDKNKPIQTFLFLGSTGVGKTALAKVVAEELYHSKNSLIRFDMSHFNEACNITRLIGSPPGYVGSEKGGQLTEALKKHPKSVVLLDEIEKADLAIHKVFLPVFDEGFITDARADEISCKDVLFIMTSNLYSSEILSLWKRGYTAEQILRQIEPNLIKALSPELYARVTPVLFRPLAPPTMEKILDLALQEVLTRIKKSSNIDITIDESVKVYLRKHGFHPNLGARPLKALIEKTVTTALSYALLKEELTPDRPATLIYSPESAQWTIL